MEKLFRSNNTFMDIISRVGLVSTRVIFGYLWFTQMLWKLPPSFGCPSNFAITTDITARSSGLCDWVGIMTIYSKWPLQASLLQKFVVPNMVWVGWIIWMMETFVALSLFFGLLTRLGGLVGLLQAINLYIGLTAAPNEWYWTYGMLALLSLIFLAIPAGRILGLDAWLRPRLEDRANKGNRLAKTILFLT